MSDAPEPTVEQTISGEPALGLGGMVPGAAIALLCGAASLGEGPAVAATVTGLLALPFAVGSWLASSSHARSLSEGLGKRAIIIGVATTLSAPALAVFGALLKANTHQRSLAGVTFAIVAAGVVAGAAALGARAASWAASRSMTPAIAKLFVVLSGLVLLGLMLRGGLVRPTALDTAGLFASLLAGWAARPREGWTKAAAAIAALPLLLSGLGVALSGNAEIARAVAARGNLAGALVLSLHPEARPATPVDEASEQHEEG